MDVYNIISIAGNLELVFTDKEILPMVTFAKLLQWASNSQKFAKMFLLVKAQ